MRGVEKIKQLDSYDCGAACLACVAAWHGVRVPLSQVRRECGCSKEGISIKGILDGAAALGLTAKAVKADAPQMEGEAPLEMAAAEKGAKLLALKSIKAPVIAHTITDNGLLHYVVICSVGEKYVEIMDPAAGKVLKERRSQFAKRWSGYLILTSASQGFKKSDAKQSKVQRLFRLLVLHKRETILAIVGSIVLTAIGVCNSLFLQMLIDKAIPSQDKGFLTAVSALILLLVPIALLIGYIRGVYLLRNGVKIDTGLILGFIRKVLKMEPAFFNEYSSGDLESRLSDTYKIRAFISEGIVSIVVCATTLLAICLLMFSFYTKLAWAVLLSLPLYCILYFISHKVNNRMSREVMSRAAFFESDVIDSFEGAKEIVHNCAEATMARYEQSYSNYIQSSYKAGKIAILFGSLSSAISQILLSVILIVGAVATVYDKISVGELVSFYTLSAFFIAPMNELMGFNTLLNDALVASERIYDLTAYREEKNVAQGYDNKLESKYIDGTLWDTNMAKAAEIPPTAEEIELEEITFRYPGKGELLSNVKALFVPRSINAICGSSGSGKSTLISLIIRDYKANSGRILYGGMDISLLPLGYWRRVVSIAPQQPFLFNTTIYENITMGRGDRSVEDMKRVSKLCSMCGMDKMLKELPYGILTMVGTKGKSLSGGQQQMISIARMLYSNAPVMILDEATSFMDEECAGTIMELMRAMVQKGRCVIVVSHNSHTISYADRRIYLTG